MALQIRALEILPCRNFNGHMAIGSRNFQKGLCLRQTENEPSRRYTSLWSQQRNFVCIRSRNENALEGSSETKSEKIADSLAVFLEGVSDLDGNFLATLPNDLKSDVKDAAFSLSSGPILRELGDTAGTVVLALGSSLEQGDTSLLKKEVQKLPGVALSLQDGGKEQLFLGKKLVAASRPLISCGDKKLAKLGETLKVAGEALKEGIQETEASERWQDASRILKFGNLQVELTARKAFAGATIAFVFGVVCFNLANGVHKDPIEISNVVSENAPLVEESLEGPLRLIFLGSAFLAGINTIGLLVLGVNLSSSKRNE